MLRSLREEGHRMHTPDRGFEGRLGVTLLVLLAFSLGCQLPLPGLDAQQAAQLAGSGAGIARVSVLALGIMPLLSALILIELAKLAAPELRAWERATPRNQHLYGYIAVGLALVLALVQSAGIASALEQVTALVPEPGTGFRITTIATLMAGAALVMAFANIIDRAGIGNGVWIMFLAPALSELPRTVAAIAAMHIEGQYPFQLIAASIVFLVLAIAAVVALLLAARNREVVASTCAWTPLIAYSLLPWLLLPIGLIGTRSADGAIALMLTGPIHYVVLTVLVVLIAALSVRSFARIGEPSPVPAVIIGVTLAAIVVAADLIQVYLSAVPPLMSTNLIVAAVVGVALLGRWGTLPSGAPAEIDPPVSPQA
jgi:preprotein translocase subunit SecY